MPKIVRFHKTGGPEVLKIEDLPLLEPGSDEVRLQVEAFGLNRAELLFRQGKYLPITAFPSRIGYEAAGVIDAVGSKVTGLKIGDRVSTIPCFHVGDYGVYGASAVVPARAVTRYPAHLDAVQAAAIWMQYLTAWAGLIQLARLARGDSVIITAASSSVGVAAIQVARATGATVIATTRSADKKAALLKVGADQVIVTDQDNVVERVMAITSGKGATVAYDPIGGPNLAKMVAAVKQGGLVIIYGSLYPGPTELPILQTAMKSVTIRPYALFEFISAPDMMQLGIKYVTDGLTSGQLQPVIDRTFKLEDIVAAHAYMENNQHLGKIVVTV